MAKKKNRGNNEATKRDDFEAPEGFEINVERERGSGWIAKTEENMVTARLLARHEYKTKRGKTRAFYQLELLAPAKCQVPNPDYNEHGDDDDENNPTMIDKELPAGEIVNVDEFKKLEDLRPYCKDGGVYDVWFVILGKVDIGDDQTMWDVKGPKLRVVKAPQQAS